MRILIANRGEIARRVIRTAHRLRHQTVAAYADPDADAPWVAEATMAVRIGGADLADSYLSVDNLLDGARRTGADAVHPGYGFLAENAGFARAVIAAGLTWIGPNPDAIDAMGSKIEARRLADAAGVPIIPGFDGSQDPDELATAADQIGYPVLAKAAAGGGGKGIRVVYDPADFAAALAEASSEAQRSFGDGAMIVERYVERPRHVEVQIVGDASGAVIHLGTRDCSVQRRYQKVLEEAPAPNLPAATRAGLQDAAVALGASIGYDSAGTVEFIVDDETGDYYFLEMNTRLQVEHPVTEFVTGLDLVELQLAVAGGGALPLTQDQVSWAGHAFEARINAEDPTADFAPQLGTITHLRVPQGCRWDAAVELGSTITPFYDSMIAKLIVGGDDRDAARRSLAAVLDQLVLGGVITTAGFHRWLVEQPPVVAGRVTTRFLDETHVPPPAPIDLGVPARAWLAARSAVNEHAQATPWSALGSFRVTPHQPAELVALRDHNGDLHEVAPVPAEASRWLDSELELVVDGCTTRVPATVDVAGRSVAVTIAGHTHVFAVPSRAERWAPADAVGHGSADAVVAPFPAVVTEVHVAPGDAVAAGQPVLVIEAMKMLHTLGAAGPGVVDDVRIAPGDQVAGGQILVTFETELTPAE